jgi:hypothetical protein
MNEQLPEKKCTIGVWSCQGAYDPAPGDRPAKGYAVLAILIVL